jgi:hypothetical protein
VRLHFGRIPLKSDIDYVVQEVLKWVGIACREVAGQDRDWPWSEMYYAQRLTIEKEELNRQADFYDIFSRLFERRLFLPADLTPEFILDCGSGGGIEWAEEVMEKSEMGPGSSSSEDDDFACQVSLDGTGVMCYYQT